MHKKSLQIFFFAINLIDGKKELSKYYIEKKIKVADKLTELYTTVCRYMVLFFKF